jgi:predicted dehydrogenase
LIERDDQPGRGLRIAIAGASHWHFEVDARYLALVRASGAELVGLSDDDEPAARARAELAECPWTLDHLELVSRFKPDLVLAMPRPDRAAAQIGALLETGCPIFAEKPLGLNASQVWPLVERAADRWVAVAFPNRYLPIFAQLARLRDAGRLGTLRHLAGRLIKGSGERYVNFGVPWMLDPAIAGGGPLRNLGIHLADMLNWQLGPGAARVVSASTVGNLCGQAIEDYAAGLLQTGDGVSALVEAGYSLAPLGGSDVELRFAATGAFLIQRGLRLEIQPAEGSPDVVEAQPRLGLYGELFFDCLRRLRRDQPPPTTIRDCALANETIDAIYAAAG